MPLRTPKPMITVRESNGLFSNRWIHCATWSEQKVTIKCQLVNVVAKVNPRVLMRALLQMTIATDDITDRHSAPTVPSWQWPETSAMSFKLFNAKTFQKSQWSSSSSSYCSSSSWRNRKRCAVPSLLCNTSPKLLALSASKHYFLALAPKNNSSTCSRTNAIKQKRKPKEKEEEDEEAAAAAWSSHLPKGKESARKQEDSKEDQRRCNAPATIDPGSKTRTVVVERASRSPPVQPKTKTKTGNQRIHNNVQADCQRI